MEMTFGPVRLLLGARYGKRQASGLSATNEEYREAKTRCRVLAFVQRDVDRGAHHQQALDIYRPDQWHDFFITVGGGAAALTGLVFVAMSLNVAVIAQDATHRYRAIGTLTG